MPTAPEFMNAVRTVRMLKILLKMKSKHGCHTDCHIGISTKIIKYLKRITHSTQPCNRHPVLSDIQGKYMICHLSQSISKDQLLK